MPTHKPRRKVGRRRPSSDHGPTQNVAGTLAEGEELAARYADLGASVGYDPLSFLGTRRYLLGQRRFGKTILMAGQANTAYLDWDGGSNNRMMGPGSVRFPISTWEDMEKIFKRFTVEVRTKKWPFRHVVFDTLDTMRQRAREHLSIQVRKDIVDYGREGKGYDMMTRLCLMPLHTVSREFKVGWTAIAHLKYRTVKDEDGKELQAWAPAINPGLSDGIAQLADLLMEIRRIPIQRKDGEYDRKFILETITPPECDWTSHELGTRVPMNTEIELPKQGGITVLEKEYVRAVEEERENWT